MKNGKSCTGGGSSGAPCSELISSRYWRAPRPHRGTVRGVTGPGGPPRAADGGDRRHPGLPGGLGTAPPPPGAVRRGYRRRAQGPGQRARPHGARRPHRRRRGRSAPAPAAERPPGGRHVVLRPDDRPSDWRSGASARAPSGRAPGSRRWSSAPAMPASSSSAPCCATRPARTCRSACSTMTRRKRHLRHPRRSGARRSRATSPRAVAATGAEVLFIAMPSAAGALVRELVRSARRRRAEVKVLPSVSRAARRTGRDPRRPRHRRRRPARPPPDRHRRRCHRRLPDRASGCSSPAPAARSVRSCAARSTGSARPS